MSGLRKAIEDARKSSTKACFQLVDADDDVGSSEFASATEDSSAASAVPQEGDSDHRAIPPIPPTTVRPSW